MVIPPSAHAGTLCQSLAPWKWFYHLQPMQAPYAKVWHHINGYTTFSPRRHPMRKFRTMEMVIPPSAHPGTLCESLAPLKWSYHLQPTQAPYAKVWHHGNGYTTFSPCRHPMPKFGTMEMVIPPSAHAGTLCQRLAPWKWLYHLQPTQAPYAKVWHHGNGYTTFSPRRHPMPKIGTMEMVTPPSAHAGTLCQIWHHGNGYTTFSPPRHPMPKSGTIEKILAPLAQTGTL